MKRALKGNPGSRQTGRKAATTKVLYVEHDGDNLYMLKNALSDATISRFSRLRTACRAVSWP